MDGHAILMTVIAFSAVLTVLITILTFIFNSLLNPVKENQARMEKELNQFKTEIKVEVSDLKEEVSDLKVEMSDLKKEVNAVNTKLDKLLSKA